MTLISTACSWVNMFGGHKAAIFTQVGQFYFGRWVSFSSAVTTLQQPGYARPLQSFHADREIAAVPSRSTSLFSR